MIPRSFLLTVGLLATGLAAQGAAAVTASGRALDAGLDAVLGGAGAGGAEERTLMLVVDPHPDLVTAGFVAALEAALRKNAARLAKTDIGVAIVDSKAPPLPPGRDHEAVVRAVSQSLVDARDEIRNVYAAVRSASRSLAKKPGRRELILVSFTNGDAEDDVEGTVAALKGLDIVFRAIVTESFLADSYWQQQRAYQKTPPKTELTGGDSAFVDVPWGWALQVVVANEVAPSGHACYGISRLATATGGRIHLYSPPSSQHQCAIYGGCLFCSGDHTPTKDTYWRTRVALYTPSAKSRAEVFADAGSDPWLRATLNAWQQASKAGLLRGMPTVKASGNGLVPQRARPGRVFSASGSTNFSSQARRAEKAAKDCARILASLQRQMKSISDSQGSKRSKTGAEFTCVMLQLTKVNLTTFAGWCREVAPRVMARRPPEYELPEVDPVARERRVAGVGISTNCLCHGVAPFFEVELPGGDALRRELLTLQSMVDRFENLYGHTPFASGLHRSGISTFHPTYEGVYSKADRRRPKSKDDKNPLTERGRTRPPRTGGSSGGTSGPTTGK